MAMTEKMQVGQVGGQAKPQAQDPRPEVDDGRDDAGDDRLGISTALALLPEGAILNLAALARILGRHPKSVERSIRRAELPQGIRLLGRRVWLAGALQQHLHARQEEAIRAARRRDQNRPKLFSEKRA